MQSSFFCCWLPPLLSGIYIHIYKIHTLWIQPPAFSSCVFFCCCVFVSLAGVLRKVETGAPNMHDVCNNNKIIQKCKKIHTKKAKCKETKHYIFHPKTKIHVCLVKMFFSLCLLFPTIFRPCCCCCCSVCTQKFHPITGDWELFFGCVCVGCVRLLPAAHNSGMEQNERHETKCRY